MKFDSSKVFCLKNLTTSQSKKHYRINMYHRKFPIFSMHLGEEEKKHEFTILHSQIYDIYRK